MTDLFHPIHLYYLCIVLLFFKSNCVDGLHIYIYKFYFRTVKLPYKINFIKRRCYIP